MSSLDLHSFRGAIASLDAALSVAGDDDWLARQSRATREVVAAGVIQNFEIVYELAVKMIARSLAIEAATPAAASLLNFRDMIRRAGEAGLIDDPNAWFDYREQRNITAHTYDVAKARRVGEGARVFAIDARRLLERLKTRHG